MNREAGFPQGQVEGFDIHRLQKPMAQIVVDVKEDANNPPGKLLMFQTVLL